MPNSIPLDFTVRIRFRIPAGNRIGINSAEVAFTPAASPEVILKAGDNDKPINESDWLILQSSGWESEGAAEAASEPLMDALRRALAKHRMGADFGRRSAQGRFFEAFLKGLEETNGRPTLNDVHGVMVFPTEPRPILARIGSMHVFRSVLDDHWRETFTFALQSRVRLSERERTAFDLFSFAHSASDSVDARFVLLFAAIETLLEDKPRPMAVVDQVNRLIDVTRASDLDKVEKESLLGSLRWLRSQSIRSSGRCFVRERLPDRKYQERSAEEFFLDCYDLRNRLLHGRQPFPTREEVGALVGSLDQMVSHLLAGSLLDFDTAQETKRTTA